MKAKQEIKTSNVDIGFRYLLVSLFLAVLAFFIVLNSISQQNKIKQNKFFDEFQEEFVGKDLASKMKISKRKNTFSGGSTDTINIKNVIHEFLVSSSLLVISEYTDYGQVLEIKLTKGAVFNTASDFPKTSATEFIRGFSKLLKEQRKIHKFKLEIVMSFEEGNSSSFELNAKRAYAVIEKFKYNLEDKVNSEAFLVPYYEGDNKLSFVKILINIDET